MTYLFAAYAAVWGLLFAYVASLARRQKALREQLDTLQQLMDRADGAAPGTADRLPPRRGA